MVFSRRGGDQGRGRLSHGLGLQQDLVAGLGWKHIQNASGWDVIISQNGNSFLFLLIAGK